MMLIKLAFLVCYLVAELGLLVGLALLARELLLELKRQRADEVKT